MADFSRAMKMLASKKAIRRLHKQKEPYDRAKDMKRMSPEDRRRQKAVDRANRKAKMKKKY